MSFVTLSLFKSCVSLSGELPSEKASLSQKEKCALAADILFISVTIIAGLAIFFSASSAHLHLVSYCMWGGSGCIVLLDSAQLIYRSHSFKSLFYSDAGGEKIPPIGTTPQPTEDLQCPSKYQIFYDLAPKEFATKILDSNQYNKEEKMKVFQAAEKVYSDSVTGSVITPQSWIDQQVTMAYLIRLSVLNPHFSTFLCHRSPPFAQMDNLEEADCSILANALPNTLEGNHPYLFAHALRINDKHRTAFLVDLKYKKVEFFNSFGTDHEVIAFFKLFVQTLSEKYQTEFQYIHRTQGTRLQKDVYHCGFWTCKITEERIQKGIHFNLNDYMGFDIDSYRKVVLDAAFEFTVYYTIGHARYTPALRTLHHKKGAPPLTPVQFYDWGKTGNMPAILSL